MDRHLHGLGFANRPVGCARIGAGQHAAGFGSNAATPAAARRLWWWPIVFAVCCTPALVAAQPGDGRWLADGLPTPQAIALLDAMAAAELRGLDPADYADAITLRAQAVDDPALAMRFEAALDRDVASFAQHLHRGRINPRQLGLELDVDKPFDAHVVRERLASAADPLQELDALEPPFPSYRRLRRALATYLALAAHADAFVLPALPARVLEPGEPYAGSALLATRLQQLGDLAPASADPDAADGHYGPELVDAVRRFQRRHGLHADGRIGPRTRAALDVPMSSRVAQIRLALERWRWAPLALERPPIVVNIPEFRLRAVGDDGRVAFETDVVVGRAFRRQTPVFADRLRTVVFQPSWHVPTSIVRADLVPRATRDPDYLARHGYVITGRDAQTVTPEVLDGLRRGRYGLRQTPGPHNALGAVKFLFPNDHNVYLHDTPSTELFDRERRDFSSGCVRVRDPAGLAEWVLRHHPAWPAERIRAALSGGPGDLGVAVVPPIPVYLVYVTAVAVEGGELRFFDDIYGHDARLQQALDAAARR